MSSQAPKPPRAKPSLSPLQKALLVYGLAFGISAYAAYGLWQGELSLVHTIHQDDITRRRMLHLHFHGVSAWLMALGIWLLAGGMVLWLRAESAGERRSKAEALALKVTLAGLALCAVMFFAGFAGLTG